MPRPGQPLSSGVHEGLTEQAERQVEAILLLGVDGEAEAVAARGGAKLDQAWQQLAVEALLLAGIEARMQRRQLDRDAGPPGQRLRVPGEGRSGFADRLDRFHVALEVAQRVGFGAGPLAQHVIGEQVAARLQRSGASQRFLDGAAEHEVVGQDAHGLAQRLTNEGLAGARDETLHHAGGAGTLVGAELDHAAGQHQAECRGVDEQAVGGAQVLVPLAAADLLGDQRIGGVLVGDAQQGLGQAHQDDAFLAREAVLVHEGVDAAMLVAVGARGAGQPAGQLGDAPALVIGVDGPLDQTADQAGLIEQVIGGDLVAGRQRDGHGGILVRSKLPGAGHSPSCAGYRAWRPNPRGEV